ncbi:MAG: hypothetical protein ACYDCK_09405 [Thermoplasmatota archaeon]
MNAKVARLVSLVDEGYVVDEVDAHLNGGLTMSLVLGDAEERLEFEFYEIPAIYGATRVVGVAQ